MTAASVKARVAWFRNGIAFALLLTLTVSLQVASGAYQAEFWGWDEAAHFVTGRMFHDYVAQGFPGTPLEYARKYYEQYPKVAIGHWPPVFYLVQGMWTLVAGVSRSSLLLMQATLAASVAFLLWRFLVKDWDWRPALLLAASLPLLPHMQSATALLMAEVICMLLVLAAALQYGRFLDNPGWRNAVLFSVLACVAVLTKINGLVLAFIPPLAVLLTRRFGLMRKAQFWFPAVFVAAIAGPWYLFTADMAMEGWRGSTSPQFLAGLTLKNVLAQAKVAGYTLVLLGILGFAAVVGIPFVRRRPVASRWAVMAALSVGVFIFHTWVFPVREARHMLLAAPAILALAFGGLAQLMRTWRDFGPAWQMMIAAACIAIFLLTSFRIPPKHTYGAREVVDELQHHPDLQRVNKLLVSSATEGEGALISELALRRGLAGPRVIRATKLLMNADWGGFQSQLLATTPQQVCHALQDAGIEAVALDQHPPASSHNTEHHRLLETALQQHCRQAWRLADGWNSRAYQIYIRVPRGHTSGM